MRRWVVWTIVVVGWTVALQVPAPPARDLPAGELLLSYRTYFTKSLHVVTYALLAVLSAWVKVPVRYRALLMFFLMVHATLTELLQVLLYDFCHRGGSLGDVGFDHLGIALGTLISWKGWTRTDAAP